MSEHHEQVPPGVDPTTPSAGRLYDFYLGGSEYFEVDRIAGEQVRALVPELSDIAWANRGFLQRAAGWLAGGAGLRQFIDIGAGLPTRNNTHEAAQDITPDARVVYVDNDPMVYAHAQQLLEDEPNAWMIQADARDPEAVLAHPVLREHIDFDQPIGLMLVALVHFIRDEDDPWALTRRFVDALPSGSYLALSHVTDDYANPETIARLLKIYENATEQVYCRGKDDAARFFEGLEIVPPYADAPAEVTFLGNWGAHDLSLADSDGSHWGYCAVARKP